MSVAYPFSNVRFSKVDFERDLEEDQKALGAINRIYYGRIGIPSNSPPALGNKPPRSWDYKDLTFLLKEHPPQFILWNFAAAMVRHGFIADSVLRAISTKFYEESYRNFAVPPQFDALYDTIAREGVSIPATLLAAGIHMSGQGLTSQAIRVAVTFDNAFENTGIALFCQISIDSILRGDTERALQAIAENTPYRKFARNVAFDLMERLLKEFKLFEVASDFLLKFPDLYARSYASQSFHVCAIGLTEKGLLDQALNAARRTDNPDAALCAVIKNLIAQKNYDPIPTLCKQFGKTESASLYLLTVFINLIEENNLEFLHLLLMILGRDDEVRPVLFLRTVSKLNAQNRLSRGLLSLLQKASVTQAEYDDALALARREVDPVRRYISIACANCLRIDSEAEAGQKKADDENRMEEKVS